VALIATFMSTQFADATHATGSYAIISPLGGSDDWITSPTRYHTDNPFDGGTCPVDNLDDPDFDGLPGQPCRSAVTDDGAPGDWSIDIGGVEDDPVYIDINPSGIDGASAGGQYRVVAGSVLDFRPNDTCANDKYQYFRIHVYNSGTSTWENYAWIVLGHMDSSYADGATVISSRTTQGTAIVGYVAAGSSCWPQHIHMEAYNYANYSRSYDWDGPRNNTDTSYTGPCIRSGSQPDLDCNAKSTSSDVIGYVGGTKTSFQEVNNPYYSDF